MNYKEYSGAASIWTRCYELTIYNPYASNFKSIDFYEEQLTKVRGEVISYKKLGSTSTSIDVTTDLEKTFELLNPETGEVIGTATYAQLYTMLHSLYIKTAIKRDEISAEREAAEARLKARIEQEARDQAAQNPQ